MKKMGLNEIREKFLSFFESKEHLRMNSHSLVPENDNSLLLINSGMAPLKPFFTGQQTPPRKRVTTCQKCIRTGDIENVGKTARHGTFFEMLGNFSFGDYFKEEIIPWSWEFCVDVMEIPEDKLYVSVYLDDDEAFEIWNKKVGVPVEKIFRMGKEDNFWEVGLGPCGPCSEIYYDRGEKYGCGESTCTVGCDCDRYLEFWNLVFTQFDKKEDGSYERLQFPNIDTGMGLERMAVLMQDVYSLFDVDTVKAIRDKICEISGKKYMESNENDVSIRVITDHVRAMTFLTGDGVLPSNEGRGYVLRRLIRRATRHGKLLGVNKLFLAELCQVAIEQSKGAYPELQEKRGYILKVITFEEERFNETLDQGTEKLKSYISKLKSEGKTVMEGTMSFMLYDTFGFPVDLTMEILAENGLTLDEDSFKKEMESQRERARAAREESTFMGAKQTVYEKLDPDMATEFEGYEQALVESAKVLAITADERILEQANEGEEISIFTDKTPFYAESGGQAGDTGIICSDNGQIVVTDCIKTVTGKIAHICKVESGSVKTGDTVKLEINRKKRLDITRGHSATHLLHKALREVLGEHVEQAGSYVTNEKLRFDFTHFSAMTAEEINKTQNIVMEKIFESIPVDISYVSIEEARKMGAMALFSEKYGDVVRVVKMGEYSCELCGGCHLPNTSGVGTFKILSEAGVAAGIRRIEALTGYGAIAHYNEMENMLDEICKTLKTTPENINNRIAALVKETKELARQKEAMEAKMAGSLIDEIAGDRKNIKGVDVAYRAIEGMDISSLRALGDQLKDKLSSGIIVLLSTKDDAVSLLVMATDDAVKKGAHAGKIIAESGGVIGCKGGGRPNMAQAGGKNPVTKDKINEAINKALTVIDSQLGD